MYSQHAEEAAILAACEHIESGRFLDVGAYHPTMFSNTRALFERGWRGVMIEPSPACARVLVQEYGRVEGMAVVAACVIASDPGLRELAVTDDAVSTADPRQAERWRERGAYYGKLWVPTLTFADVINRWGCFNFVSIDTEGSSMEIFCAVMATEMKPACVCVEHDGRVAEAVDIAQAAGYHLTYKSDENLVFSL